MLLTLQTDKLLGSEANFRFCVSKKSGNFTRSTQGDLFRVSRLTSYIFALPPCYYMKTTRLKDFAFGPKSLNQPTLKLTPSSLMSQAPSKSE